MKLRIITRKYAVISEIRFPEKSIYILFSSRRPPASVGVETSRCLNQIEDDYGKNMQPNPQNSLPKNRFLDGWASQRPPVSLEVKAETRFFREGVR